MSDSKCVICGKPIERRPANRWYPFCSQRCRMVNLGKWLGEEYRIPGGPAEVEEEVPSEGERGGGEGELH